MSATAFFSQSFANLHKSLEDTLNDLSLEQLHWRPENKGNDIAFVVWHYARTEDNIISTLQQKDTIWQSGGWASKLGLPEQAQGTGMSEEEAAAIRLKNKEDLIAYIQQVWQQMGGYLSSVSDADLEKTITMGRMGERPILNIIGGVLLTHGYTHFGEISEIRALLPK